jgi:hypothetical protein
VIGFYLCVYVSSPSATIIVKTLIHIFANRDAQLDFSGTAQNDRMVHVLHRLLSWLTCLVQFDRAA